MPFPETENPPERAIWGVKDQEVSLGYVKFKMSTRHPNRDIEQVGGCIGLEFMGDV